MIDVLEDTLDDSLRRHVARNGGGVEKARKAELRDRSESPWGWRTVDDEEYMLYIEGEGDEGDEEVEDEEEEEGDEEDGI